MQRDIPDVISLVGALATAIPASIRQVAATNIPVFSSILNEEFLDGKRPQWFQELPVAIQSYLISRFGLPTSATIAPSIPTTPSPAFTTSPIWSENLLSTPTIRTLIPTSTLSPSQTAPTISTFTTRPPQSLISSHMTSQLPTPHAEAATASNSGLNRSAKIAIGVGVPLGLIAIAAVLLTCFFLRRRWRKSVNGSVPPSSPGFIPRFAFQQGDREDGDVHRHLTHPANRERKGVDPWLWDANMNKPGVDHKTNGEMTSVLTMAPAICHTHSSNRARGRRTSYTSLNTVMEMSEPGDPNSPIHSTQPTSSSQPPTFLPPSAASQIKRKPVSSPPLSIPTEGQGYANEAAVSPDNSDFVYTWPNSGVSSQTAVSPIIPSASRQNSWGDDSYIEDYGPEYDERAVYGGGDHFDSSTSSSLRHLVEKDPSAEWPLKNSRSRNYHRNRSLVWDRVYHP